MADSHRSHHQLASLCLVGAMDRLWFHQAVIFTEPIPHQCPKPVQLISDSGKSPPSDAVDILHVLFQSQEAETESQKITRPKDDDVNGTMTTRTEHRSKSHSPKHERHHQYKTMNTTTTTTSSKRLEKTISSKTYEDLEQEEVKGFIDLGFRFKKEHISPRMINVVPGLQKIIKTKSAMDQCLDKNEINATMRPYLSEAWLIKKPDSPLLNMRVRRGYAAADMKKQLKCWARNVVTETIQES